MLHCAVTSCFETSLSLKLFYLRIHLVCSKQSFHPFTKNLELVFTVHRINFSGLITLAKYSGKQNDYETNQY